MIPSAVSGGPSAGSSALVCPNHALIRCVGARLERGDRTRRRDRRTAEIGGMWVEPFHCPTHIPPKNLPYLTSDNYALTRAVPERNHAHYLAPNDLPHKSGRGLAIPTSATTLPRPLLNRFRPHDARRAGAVRTASRRLAPSLSLGVLGRFDRAVGPPSPLVWSSQWRHCVAFQCRWPVDFRPFFSAPMELVRCNALQHAAPTA